VKAVVRLNAPEESVVSGVFNKVVGAEPLPAAPAAYSCTVAPMTDVEPARTVPLKLVPA
jgi:hypothetical protein